MEGKGGGNLNHANRMDILRNEREELSCKDDFSKTNDLT